LKKRKSILDGQRFRCFRGFLISFFILNQRFRGELLFPA